MKSLFSNIRFYVLVLSLAISVAIYLLVILSVPPGATRIVKLGQVYALTTVTYLYFALLAGPFCYTFRWFPLRAQYLKARRAIGVSAFYFALLHASLMFFGQLGGFAGIFFLDTTYLLAISLSFTALLILSLMAATSFDYMVAKLTFPKWKLLHRFVYLAGIFILIHALLIGTHFRDLSQTIPRIAFFAISFLLLLEAPRFDKLLSRFVPIPRLGLSFFIVATLLIVVFFLRLI